MLKTYTYKTVPFFLLTFLLSWTLWFGAIYASWQPSLQHFLLPLIMGGISGPALSTFFMLITSNNKELWYDFKERLRPTNIATKVLSVAVFLFPCLIILAIAVSLLFGQSADQFSMSGQTSDQVLQGVQLLGMLLVILLVGPLEELGWRGYGIDSLREKYSLLTASILLGALWGLWHIPLFFIKNGAYQEILRLGLPHTFLYFFDLLLLTIIINWLYVKSNRSILIAIIFHCVFDICMAIFHIAPATWYILTALLLITAMIIIIKDTKTFLLKSDY